MKRAVFPGSFDPITLGHEALVKRAYDLFDEIIIAIGNNTLKKNYCFPTEVRKRWIEDVFKDYKKVTVLEYDGLTVDLCKRIGADYILRGLRTSSDFDFERSVSQVNKILMPDVESIFIITSPELTPISSSVVREIYKNKGNVSSFVPSVIDIYNI